MSRVVTTLDVRARRALLRRHHPDLGGDPDEFVRVLAAIGRLGGSERQVPAVTTAVVTDRLGGGRWRRRRRRALTRVQGALPRRMPGARRYGQI